MISLVKFQELVLYFKEFGKAAQAARDASAEGASAFDARVAGVNN